ncbi:MAG TPA: hypothetical protein EYM96_07805, partial [Rhodospirillales bacterium]|nr:hypothetical protein [Rhodospirillales bacterium]
LEKYDIVYAFRAAYPDVNVANGNYYPKARRLLKRRDVQTYLEHRRADMQEIMCLDANRITQELAAVAFADITDVMHDITNVKDFDEMTPAAKKAIKKIVVKDVETKFGTNRTVTIEMHDKLRAIGDLMKSLGIGPGDAQVINGDVSVTNNVVQINAQDLTTGQLKQLVSDGKISVEELSPDTDDIVIEDGDFS